MKIKITKSINPIAKYPYFATNLSNDLFIVTKENQGICFEYWSDVRELMENLLTPLPIGTVLTITE